MATPVIGIGDCIGIRSKICHYTSYTWYGVDAIKEGKIYLSTPIYSLFETLDYGVLTKAIADKTQTEYKHVPYAKQIPHHARKYARENKIKRLARFDTNSYTGVKDGTEIRLHYIPSAGAYKISY